MSGLPALPSPWRLDAASGSDVRVEVVHFTDPACPWAYSVEPALRALEARYGDQLVWRPVLIGLSETIERYRGTPNWDPANRARSNRRFRRRGMPFATAPRARAMASGRACRLVIAAGRQDPALADALLRALRLAWFTTTLLLDEDEGLLEVAARVAGLDGPRALRDAGGEAVEARYQADREEARRPPAFAVRLRRTADTDGRDRYTAPSVVFRTDDGRDGHVVGFQPFEAYEAVLTNLRRDLVRLPVPDVAALLGLYPGGLSTAEVARALADTTDDPDPAAAEDALIGLAAAGRARRVPCGHDALWRPA